MTTRKELEIARVVAELLKPAIRSMVEAALAPLKKEAATLAEETLELTKTVADIAKEVLSLEKHLADHAAENRKMAADVSSAHKAIEGTASSVVRLSMTVDSLSERVSTTLQDVREDAKRSREVAETVSAKHMEASCASAVVSGALKDLAVRVDRIAEQVEAVSTDVVERATNSQIQLSAVKQEVLLHAASGEKALAEVRELLNTLSEKVAPLKPYDSAAVEALNEELKSVAEKLAAVSDAQFSHQAAVNEKTESVLSQLSSMGDRIDAVEVPAPYDDSSLREEVASARTEVRTLAASIKSTVAESEEVLKSVAAAIDGIDQKIVDQVSRIELPAPVPGPEGKLRAVSAYVPGSVVPAMELRSYGGGTWQAKRETTDTPSVNADDWVLIADGISSVDIEQDDTQVKFILDTAAGARIEKSVQIDSVNYVGVFDPDTEYRKNSAVTYAGSLWVAKKVTKGAQPGASGGEWQLAVKRGTDGKSVKGDAGDAYVAGFAGDYVTGQKYAKDSIVHYAGSVWLAKRSTKETPPYVTREDNDDWLRIR